MKYDPDKHNRRSIRLKGYDYSQNGAYYITICVHGRECLFGEIQSGEMHFNTFGLIVLYAWDDLPNHYPGLELDAFVIMPNHIHGILVLANPTTITKSDMDVPVGAGLRPALPPYDTNNDQNPPNSSGVGNGVAGDGGGGVSAGLPARYPPLQDPNNKFAEPPPITEIVRALKSFSSRRINELRRSAGNPVWQRGFHDRVLRSEQELLVHRRYIEGNPSKWSEDEENPLRGRP